MCKILIINNMSQIQKVNETVDVISEHITSTERDGFGFIYQGEKGVYGERTTDPSIYEMNPNLKIYNAPWLENTQDSVGKYSAPIGSGLFHGRTSTNSVSVKNTHPISKREWHLIHNGVVSNEGKDYPRDTSTDSEHLVHYLANEGIKSIEDNVSGYYAFGALDPNGQLHICRDSNATLFGTYCSTIDSVIIGTTELLIKNVAKDLDWKLTNISEMKIDQYLIFKGNELRFQQTIKPMGYNDYQYDHMENSLSYLNEYSQTSYKPATDSITQNNVESVDYKSDDFSEYLREVQHIDSSYTIDDYYGRPMQLEEFKLLSIDEQLECIIKRKDGTEVSPVNYWKNEKAS